MFLFRPDPNILKFSYENDLALKELLSVIKVLTEELVVIREEVEELKKKLGDEK